MQLRWVSLIRESNLAAGIGRRRRAQQNLLVDLLDPRVVSSTLARLRCRQYQAELRRNTGQVVLCAHLQCANTIALN